MVPRAPLCSSRNRFHMALSPTAVSPQRREGAAQCGPERGGQPGCPAMHTGRGAGGWADGSAHTTAGTRCWAETKFEKENRMRKTEINAKGREMTKPGPQRPQEPHAARAKEAPPSAATQLSATDTGPERPTQGPSGWSVPGPLEPVQEQSPGVPLLTRAPTHTEGRSWGHPVLGLPAACSAPQAGHLTADALESTRGTELAGGPRSLQHLACQPRPARPAVWRPAGAGAHSPALPPREPCSYLPWCSKGALF